jgi:predicted secreted hydrolase
VPVLLRWLISGIALLLLLGAVVLVVAEGEETLAQAGETGDFDWQAALGRMSDEGFDRLAGPWNLELPADHGAHPQARTETWTFNAYLGAPDETIGVHFILLRVSLTPPEEPQVSPWEMREAYRGHVTLLDEARGAAFGEERLHRGLSGVAGHDAEQQEVRLDRWSLHYGQGPEGGDLRLEATVGETVMNLSFSPAKTAASLGTDGADTPFRGYAITRMDAEGTVVTEGEQRQVAGLAWMDHIWGDVPLPVGPIVWDRLQLQLDDGRELSVTRTRRRDGGGTPTLSGFVVDTQGDVQGLEGSSIELEARRTWRPDAAATPYRLDWRLEAGELELNIEPVLDDQTHDFVTPVWIGMVEAEGTRDGEPVSGRGTMLLTGVEDQ